MAQKFSLDDILLSAEAARAFAALSERLTVAAEVMGAKPPAWEAFARKDGQLRIVGTLTTPSGGEVKADLLVPAEHWRPREADA